MIETPRLKNAVIFILITLSFVLSRKIRKLHNNGTFLNDDNTYFNTLIQNI